MFKKILFILTASAMLLLAGANLWTDPTFDASGNCADAHSGEKSLQFTMAEPEYYQTCLATDIQVEPYAVYQASAYVKGRAENGGGSVLVTYGWNSFGWYFGNSNPVSKYDTWTQVSNTFFVPDSVVNFTPIVLHNAKDADIKIDDLEITMVKTGAEHIAELKAKENLTDEERLLLARYYFAQGDFNAADALRTNGSHLAKVEIACLLAKRLDDHSARRPYLVDMLAYDGMHFYGCDGCIREFFRSMTLDEQCSIICDAIRKNPSSPHPPKGFQCLQVSGDGGKNNLQEQKKTIDTLIKTLKAIPEEIGKLPESQKVLEALIGQYVAKQEELDNKLKALGNARLVVDGHEILPESYVIVLPEKPTASEKQAADEFNQHYELVTGQTLEIVSETGNDARLPVIIGKAEKALAKCQITVHFDRLGADGIHLETRDGAIALSGNQRGVLYAVYFFLEEQVGVRWFTADCMTVPKSGVIDIPALRKTYIPPLEFRDQDYRKATGFPFAIRHKLNGLHIDSYPQWGGAIHYRGFVHTFNSLVPPEVYGAEHPEYFSEVNGQRVTKESQLCLTNPDVLKIAVAQVRKWIQEAAPQKVIISVSQNDYRNYCMCPKCAALTEYEGSPSGPIIHFVNAIAAEICKEYPDQIIDTLAYQYSRKPPKHVKPHPNVAVRLCTVECCFSHPLEKCPFNRKFVEDIRGWSRICRRLYIWDYAINFSHSVMPYPNLDVIQPNMDFFVRHGVTGVYEEANFFSTGGEFAELRTYLINKALWNPRTNNVKNMQEFLNAYYGPAAPFLATYIKKLHRFVCGNPNMHIRIETPPSYHLNAPRFLKESIQIFQEAREVVKDDETLLHRVNVAMLPLIYTKFSLNSKLYKRHETSLDLDNASDEPELLSIFEETIKKENMTKLCEGKGLPPLEWLKEMRPENPKIDIVTLENDFLRLEVLPQVGGRIWRGIHKTSGREIFSLSGSDGKGYVPSDCGFEFYGSDQWHGAGFDSVFTLTEQTETSVTLSCTLGNGNVFARTIELLPGKAAFKVRNSLTSPVATKNLCIRMHPSFTVNSTAKASLSFTDKNGNAQTFSLGALEDPMASNELWFRKEAMPSGSWTLTDADSGLVVINTFPVEQAGICYCNWNNLEGRVNLEQWSAPRELPANTPLVLENTYEIQ